MPVPFPPPPTLPWIRRGLATACLAGAALGAAAAPVNELDAGSRVLNPNALQPAPAV